MQELLLQIFQEVTKANLPPNPSFVTVHRWRYAKVKAIEENFLVDDKLKIAVCGDYCGGPRVEGAFRSGYLLAEHLAQIQAKL